MGIFSTVLSTLGSTGGNVVGGILGAAKATGKGVAGAARVGRATWSQDLRAGLKGAFSLTGETMALFGAPGEGLRSGLRVGNWMTAKEAFSEIPGALNKMQYLAGYGVGTASRTVGAAVAGFGRIANRPAEMARMTYLETGSLTRAAISGGISAAFTPLRAGAAYGGALARGALGIAMAPSAVSKVATGHGLMYHGARGALKATESIGGAALAAGEAAIKGAPGLGRSLKADAMGTAEFATKAAHKLGTAGGLTALAAGGIAVGIGVAAYHERPASASPELAQELMRTAAVKGGGLSYGPYGNMSPTAVQQLMRRSQGRMNGNFNGAGNATLAAHYAQR